MNEHDNLMFASQLAKLQRERYGDGPRASAIEALGALGAQQQQEDPMVEMLMADQMERRRNREGFQQREKEGATTFNREGKMKQYDAALGRWTGEQTAAREAPEREARINAFGAQTEASKAQTKNFAGQMSDADKLAADVAAAKEKHGYAMAEEEQRAQNEYFGPEPRPGPAGAGGPGAGPAPLGRAEQQVRKQDALERLGAYETSGFIEPDRAEALRRDILSRDGDAAIRSVAAIRTEPPAEDQLKGGIGLLVDRFAGDWTDTDVRDFKMVAGEKMQEPEGQPLRNAIDRLVRKGKRPEEIADLALAEFQKSDFWKDVGADGTMDSQSFWQPDKSGKTGLNEFRQWVYDLAQVLYLTGAERPAGGEGKGR